MKFQKDESLIQYKVFKKDDEPNAKGLSYEEHQQYLAQYSLQLRNSIIRTSEDMKHHESLEEGKSYKQMLDTTNKMSEEIPFLKPMSTPFHSLR